ncbi:serine/threonine-protein kinase [Kitasatospora viridis]|uniref:non-specific serine/threonine protein kinase n=1 Tax=Kitasatospora viridis TaxID=281105 RepID=A0A561TV01_9ACTN|nr:serine/threonine-protein kinase [Kitasatospora viridis]TWF90931.1 protein kinase-like protein [Kitasatospora viridis]
MAQAATHSVGDLVAERFELLAHLGAGGMGTVWRARDLLLGREVALKEVRAVIEDGPDQAARSRERVLREARALAGIGHPNVVTIHEVLDRRPRPWLVMELVPGRSLREVLLEDGPLTPVRAARIGLDVLGALDAAHSAGILHRDVKPGNVLIRPDGTAVLTDFGIATLQGTTTLTAPGDIIGSPEYMAPERINGEPVGPSCDLWSLGMLLYACVEGGNPVLRDSLWQTLRAVCELPLPSPSRAGPLAPVIDALLTREPQDRPSAGRLRTLLTAVLSSEGETVVVSTVRPGPGETPTLVAALDGLPDGGRPQPRRRPHHRHPAAVAAVVAVTGAGLVAAAAIGLAGQGRQPKPSAALPSPTAPPSPAGTGWIAQLAAVPRSAGPEDRDQALADAQQQVPGAVLLDGDAWASLPSGYWIVRAPGEFASGGAALTFCADAGVDQCSARYLSQDRADSAYHCEAAPADAPAVACARPGDKPG